MSNSPAVVAARGNLVGGGNVSEFGEETHEDDAVEGAEYGGPGLAMLMDQ